MKDPHSNFTGAGASILYKYSKAGVLARAQSEYSVILYTSLKVVVVCKPTPNHIGFQISNGSDIFCIFTGV